MNILKSNITLVGIIRAWLYGPDGKLLMFSENKNVIVNTGRIRLLAILKGDAVNLPAYIAIGDSLTAEAAGQTALEGTELARSTILAGTLENSNQTLRFSHNFAAGTGTGDVREAGLFCDASVGTLFARGLVSPEIPKGALDSATIQYDLTYNAG